MMRGLHTPVRAIRRRVFKEVAQLGFKADEDTLLADMEAIPYAIVNEDSEKYRESVYRARAIVRERLRLETPHLPAISPRSPRASGK